jgi:hypothetical protein
MIVIYSSVNSPLRMRGVAHRWQIDDHPSLFGHETDLQYGFLIL